MLWPSGLFTITFRNGRLYNASIVSITDGYVKLVFDNVGWANFLGSGEHAYDSQWDIMNVQAALI